MIKRSAVMGIGFVFLVIGLAGLALLLTAVVHRPASKWQFGLFDVKPPGPLQEGPGRQAGLERRQLPGPPDGIKQTPEPESQTEQVPAPQSGEASRNPPLAGSKARPGPSPEALQPVVILTADRDFGVALIRKLDSKEGAVLKLGADYRPGPAA